MTEYGDRIVVTGELHDFSALREALSRSRDAQMVSALNWDQSKPPPPRVTRVRHWLGDHIVSLAEWVSGKVYAEW